MDPQPGPIRIELLGLPRLILLDAKPYALERRDAALLALLALNGPTPRGRVVTLLWPDLPLRTAQTNLRQRLFRLKQRCGRELVVSDPVMALADNVSHDLHTLELDTTDAMPIDSGGTLLGALDYDDCEGLAAWVADARERWAAQRRTQLAERAARLEDEGHLHQALTYAERLTLEAPTAEHAHRRLMRLHYRRGDRSAALAAYKRCHETLGRELGTRPGAETRELAALIERSGALPAAAVTPSPVAVLRPPRLVGREIEWQALEAAWSRRQPMLIRGEPGIGKSRLAADFAAAHSGGARHRAYPGDAATPYVLVARMLRDLWQHFATTPTAWVAAELARLVPDLGAPPPSPLEPLRLRQAFTAAISHWQSEGLTALLIDDLHFADAASLELLLSWLTEPLRVQAVMTLRTDEVPSSLARWMLQSEAVLCEVTLGPLNIAAIVALLESLEIAALDSAVWGEALARHTGGNPLFILETLRAAIAAGPIDSQIAVSRFSAPGHLGKLLEHRLTQLPADALRLARMAALAGPDFSAELAAEVLQVHVLDLADSWRTLEQAQVIRGTAFAHDLIHEATVLSVPNGVALALHHLLAQALERAGRVPGRIAHHWHAAHEWSRAAPQFERAARAAQAASRPTEALQAWEAAATCHRKACLPTSQASALDCDWQVVRRLCGLGSLRLALDRSDAMLSAAADDRQRAVALVARAQVRAERRESAAALADARDAGALAERVGDARLALLAAHRAACAMVQQSDAQEAIALRRTHSDSMHLLDDEERLDWIGHFATALDYADRRSEALQAFDAAIAQAVGLRRWDSANELGCNKAIALMYLNRLQDSTDAARLAIEHGRLAGLEPASLLMDDMNLAGNLRDLGFFSEFLRLAEPLPRALREVGYEVWAFNAENDLAGGYVWLGRPDLAWKSLSPIANTQPPIIRASRLFTRAALLRRRPAGPTGESPAQLVRQAQALLIEAGATDRSYVRLKVALELAREDEPQVAIKRVLAIEGEARQREQFMLATHALLLRTEIFLRQGTPGAGAAEAAAALVAQCEHDGNPPGLYAPEVWWTAHLALTDADRPLADECLRRAKAWIEEVAADRVPPLFRQSFLTRNAVNAAVLGAAARR
jgi:DNA-binding SARP family transcriptional activator